jgi:outer membrane receptor protein involved in Fe transport
MLELVAGAAVAALQPSEPPTIIVTGRGLGAVDESPAASVTLDRTAIERSVSGRMEDVLRDVAGLTSFRRSDSRSAHPTSQGLTLRGLGGNAASRVALSLDGVPQADPFGGWIAFTAPDPHAIDRIWVTRGASGTEAGALAGSVDIDSRAADRDHPVEASLALGSRQSLDGRALAGTRWSDGFATLSGSFSRGDGFVPVVEEDRGPADRRAPYRQASGRARLVQSIGGSTEAQLNVAAYGDRRDRGFSGSDNRQRGTDASLRLVGRGALRWSALAYWQDRTFDSRFAALNDDRSLASVVLDQHVPADGWGAKVEAASSVGSIDWSAGVELRRVRGTTFEDFRFIGGAPTRKREAGGESSTVGLFGGVTVAAGGWTFGVSGRVDRWAIDEGRLLETDLSGAILTDESFADRHGWEGSGRLDIGRRISPTIQIRGAAYTNWRLPTLNELYRPFRVGADATAANAALDPERLHGIEAGADWGPSGSTRLSATVFANRLKDVIANVTLGAGPGVFPGVGFVAAGGAFRQRRNIDAIETHGLEIDGEYLRGPWRASFSYALSDARVEASGVASPLDGRRPAQIPKHQASASIDWTRGAVGLGGTARFTSAQCEDDLGERRLPSALTFDSRARWAISKIGDIELRVENLFDRRVIAAVSGDSIRERALPRTIWIGVRVR